MFIWHMANNDYETRNYCILFFYFDKGDDDLGYKKIINYPNVKPLSNLSNVIGVKK